MEILVNYSRGIILSEPRDTCGNSPPERFVNVYREFVSRSNGTFLRQRRNLPTSGTNY